MIPNKPKPYVLPKSIEDFYANFAISPPETRIFKVEAHKFEIPVHYEIIDLLGQGSYGIVVHARDTKTGENVAIKKIENLSEHQLFAIRTLRELRCLKNLKHPNIIGLKSIFLPKSRKSFKELYIVSELMETDLFEVVKSPQELSIEIIQYLLFQLLSGIKYCHSLRIIHRDLKPRNILINENCVLKVADFGLARMLLPEHQHSQLLTEYIATRWFRAPEILLGVIDYGEPVDIWSIGCIFGEMLGRKSLFRGADGKDQIQQIINVIGPRTREELEDMEISQNAIQEILTLPITKSTKFTDLLPSVHPNAINLLEKMLTFNPKKRITIDEALRHPFIVDEVEPTNAKATSSPPSFDFEFEKYDMNIYQIIDLIYEEILTYHNPKFVKFIEDERKNGGSQAKRIFLNEHSQCKSSSSFEELPQQYGIFY